MDVKRVNRLQGMLFSEWRGLSNEGRDLKIEWNMMHMYSSAQLAKLLALKRGINPELAAMAATLHDIAVVETLKKEKHAEVSEPYVRGAIERYNNGPWDKLPKITEEEADSLVKAIIKHSDKEEYSQDALTELLKDVDSVDRYLHGVKTEGEYLVRCNNVLKEFGIGE